MENGAFAPKEQMLHFPYFFQMHDISKTSKGVIMSKGLNICIGCSKNHLIEMVLLSTHSLCFGLEGKKIQIHSSGGML